MKIKAMMLGLAVSGALLFCAELKVLHDQLVDLVAKKR